METAECGIQPMAVGGPTDADVRIGRDDCRVTQSVLVVEDERKIRELVRGYLERAGLQVLTTGSGADAIALAHRTPLDLVIVDLGLPDVPGEEVVRALREFSDVPVLVLTAKASEEDRIHGLELGADDYLTKPFSPRELVLRARAILRRGRLEPGQDDAISLGAGELVIDEATRSVLVRDRQVELTPTEWGLLTALSGTPGRVYSRFELINRIRGYEFDGYERTIDSHVKNLRRKIEVDPHEPRIVSTVLGVGYRLGLRRDD
jgi:DNA-binding response OmpR family regulator